MSDPNPFDDLAKKLCEALPPAMRNLQEDLERSFKSILQSAFTKMDLITRQEFDVQAGVLARTRTKLEALEIRVTQLEQQLLDVTKPEGI